MELGTVGIVGCSGFIGSHLIRYLLEHTRCKIIGVDCEQSRIDEFLSEKRFCFFQTDVLAHAEYEQKLLEADIVFSLAAICTPANYITTPLQVIEINYQHPVQLAQFCQKHNKWLIHFSTSEVYGKTLKALLPDANVADQVLFEDSSPLIMGPISATRWSYASAKQLAERTIHALGQQRGLTWSIIRPFNFIGPQMDYIPGIDGEGIPRVAACFMDCLLHNKPLRLVNGGQARRTFTSIYDAVEALGAIVTSADKSKNQIFNIGNPANEVSIAEFAEHIIQRYRILFPHAPCPRVEAISAEKFYGEGYEDSDQRIPDISKITRLTGWKPRRDLQQTIDCTITAFFNDYSTQGPAHACA